MENAPNVKPKSGSTRLSNRYDFFSAYLEFTAGSEVPTLFHRWAAISGIGAILRRNTYLRHGTGKIFPNVYSMLIGNAGTRKSTAIKLFKRVLVKSGYNTIAASKTTKEKFLLDLSGIEGDDSGANVLDEQLFGAESEASCCLIAADEFNDFFGNNNLEFISLLGSLWDWDGPYENRIKNGKSFVISNPTISILGGNTPTGFSLAFPSEILGQGFFSRILLIYGEPNGTKIAFPEEKSEEDESRIVNALISISHSIPDQYHLDAEAKELLTYIYKVWAPIQDVRFESYSTRRFTHLLKLCIIHAAAALNKTITVEDVIAANTILTHTEHLMPKALGEFGKSKHSDTTQKIMQVLDGAAAPVSMKDLWKHVSSDLDNMNELAKILQNLSGAEKIFASGPGFLAKRRAIITDTSGIVDTSYLTADERKSTI